MFWEKMKKLQVVLTSVHNIQKLQTVVFYFLLFFLPQQFGKHFWPGFSLVQGIRVDYLSPTLYISDICLFLLFLITLYVRIKFKEVSHETFQSVNIPLVFFALILIMSTLIAKNMPAALFGTVKILEMAFLFWYVKTYFKRSMIPFVIDIFAINALLNSILSIWQFYLQHSVGGVWYFLGERMISPSSIGAAVMNIQGTVYLRPYGFFSHPNISAFFLFTSLVFILNRIAVERNKKEAIFLLVVCVFSFIALLLTFSRVIIFLALLYFGAYFIIHARKKILAGLLIGVLFMGIYFTVFNSRFFSIPSLLKDISYRSDLNTIAWNLFTAYPYLGVGVHNFYFYEVMMQKKISPTLLQPPHNIYLIVLVELGIVGFVLFLYFLYGSLRRLIKRVSLSKNRADVHFYNAIAWVFLALLSAGFFDHFFLTIQQGQLLLAFILGICWSKKK